MEQKNLGEVGRQRDAKRIVYILRAVSGLIGVGLGVFCAVRWLIMSHSAEEALAIFTIPAAFIVNVTWKKWGKDKCKKELIILGYYILFNFIVSFGFSFAMGLFVGFLFTPRTDAALGQIETVKLESAKPSETDDSLGVPIDSVETEKVFQAKVFCYADDELLIDLVYYTDGVEIEDNEIEDAMKRVIKNGLRDSGYPTGYEDDDKTLNQGVYAENTRMANEYYNAYNDVKTYSIARVYKVDLLLEAEKYRILANNNYVTIENSRNLVWVCEALRDELDLCIANGVTHDKVDVREAAKECNRYIMDAVWNIFQIQTQSGEELDEDMRDEMIQAYEWELKWSPEDGADYDALIHVFEKL